MEVIRKTFFKKSRLEETSLEEIQLILASASPVAWLS